MAVFEEGDPSSKILILGEAPAKNEIRLGRPFVGQAGDVLNQCLQAANIPRRRCYINNVWPFMIWKDRANKFWVYDSPRATEDDLMWGPKTNFSDGGLRHAQPTCDRIRASNAHVVVAMGQQAFELCTGMYGAPIGKWRGSIIEGDERIGKKKVIPTYHPAATLHGTYLWQYMIISDLEKARIQAEFPDVRHPKRNLILEPSLSDVLDFLNDCTKAGRVATDLEVINHQVSCFSLCHDPSEAMTVPLRKVDQSSYWTEEQEMELWRAYAKIMGDEKVDKINQNIIGFDAPFLLQQNHIVTRGFQGDTMIAQHVLYPDFPKGLDFICSVHTNEPYYKDEGKMWKGMGGDIEQFWRYCAKDAAVALEAWDKLSQEMTEGDYWTTYEMTASLAEPLNFMTIFGLKIDTDNMAKLNKKLQEELTDLEESLAEVADYEFNPTSPKQCAEYFYNNKGIAPYKNRTGGITTDDKAMARILRRYHFPEAGLVQQIRKLRKLISVSMEVKLDDDGRLRCSWNPRGTWTGRLSSGKTIFGSGMNFQNMDPRFKRFIIAE